MVYFQLTKFLCTSKNSENGLTLAAQFEFSMENEFCIFKIKRKDINGNVAESNVKTNSLLEKEDALIKTADFYVERNFTIDLFTELVISKIPSKTKITIYINVL